MRYVCGCNDQGQNFVFCSTHALSDDRVEIERFWRLNYKESDWPKYKEALVIGLKLELA